MQRYRRASWIVLALVAPSIANAQPKKDGKQADPDEGGEVKADPDEGGEAKPTASEAPTPATPTRSAPVFDERPTKPRFDWQPYGYLRMQYRIAQNDPNVEFVGRDDGFELQNARFGIRGKLDNRVGFVLSIDGAVDERTQLNDPEGKLRVGLRDAYADVKLGGKIDARGGFFRTLMDPDGLVADTARLTVDRPLEARGIRATEGFETQGLTPGRSLGFAIRLVPEVNASSGIESKPGTTAGDDSTPDTSAGFGFEVAVQNGADEFSSNNDNDKPAVSGALIGKFGPSSWAVAGVRYNPRTAGELPFRRDENDIQASAGLHGEGGPVVFDSGFVLIRTSYPSTDVGSSIALGGHAGIFFRTGNMAFGYRFGILDPSSLVVTDRVMEHTAAATIAVPRYRMRVQFQATHEAEQAARALANSRIQLGAEVSL